MGTEIWADSCSPEDIQDAVDAVVAGGYGTVRLPAETGFFSDETITIPGSVSVIGSGTVSTILEQTQAAPFNDMFDLNASANQQPTRISGIQFKGCVTSSNDDVIGVGIRVRYGLGFRIDYCNFIDFPNAAITANNPSTGINRGVIDHNIIDNPYKDIYVGPPQPLWAYGIVVIGNYAYWDSDITKFLGKYETAPVNCPMVYIEDNIISRCRHAIASNQAAWYVARYNTISEARPKNYGQIDIHGSAGEGLAGGRGYEVYNNIVSRPDGYTSYSAACLSRGGGGVIYDNIFNFVSGQTAVALYADNINPDYNVKQLYIWNNTINGGASLLSDYDDYTEDVEYFLRAPTQEDDGFTYSPYTYPHPLTGNGNGDGNGVVQRKMLLQNLRFV